MSPARGAAWCHTMWLVAGFSLCGPVEVSAQHASIGYQSQLWSPAELRRFHGGLLRVQWNNGVELSFDLGVARWTELGSTCSGLILDPSDCVLETIDVGSETMGVAVGYSLVDWRVPGGRFMVAPAIGFSFAHLGRTGQTTGGANDDSQPLLDVALSARYRTEPLLWRLVSLFAEIRVSAGKDISPGICADCYDPLHDDVARRSALVGLSIGR